MTRPKTGAKYQVWLSRSETAEWGDDEFRENALKGFRVQAREKGRKFVEVFANSGCSLHVCDA